jgi:C-terminal peptidase prc
VGSAEEPATLTVLRAPGVKAEPARVQQVRLVPKQYEVETVQGLYRDANGRWVHRLGERLAYVRITEFVERTREQIERACRQSPQAQGLVLDLRDNPGGRPEFAAQIANWFLSEGEIFRIVSIKDAKPEQKAYVAHKEGTYPQDVRLAVLIDEDTASAAEIVAGALRVHHRAVLVGVPTRGKTRVQSMVPISDLGMIVVSTGRFYLGGEGPEEEGAKAFSVERIVPDRKVPPPETAADALEEARARAAALPGKPPFVGLNLPEGETLGDELLRCDPQLSVATELLRTEERYDRLRKSVPPWLNATDE